MQAVMETLRPVALVSLQLAYFGAAVLLIAGARP